jgi:sialic acid synthase SpsE
MQKKIQLTKKAVVSNYGKPYIIAEIGANHNGDMELAKKMIDAAIEAGCDAVKFQSWTATSLISDEEYKKNQKYDDSAKKHFGSLKEMVEQYALTTGQHYELNDYCQQKGVDFCSTPFSNEEVDLLESIDVPFYKVASMDINNVALLQYIAEKNKPVILSTGMSTIGEIEAAIDILEAKGNTNIILLHCISIYPPLYEDIHLNNILTLQQTFGYPVGFSDHTIGFSIPLASISLGACVIEKHFTIDKDLPGWDHEISADPAEMKIICAESDKIFRAMGNHKRVVSKAEQEKKLKFRRSAVANANLPKGSILKASDISFKRPGTGIAPNYLDGLVGRVIKEDISADQLIKWEHLS